MGGIARSDAERVIRAPPFLSHAMQMAGSGSIRPLSKIPHCSIMESLGRVSVTSVADHPRRPAKRHWLGQPLPDQLPDTPRAHRRQVPPHSGYRTASADSHVIYAPVRLPEMEKRSLACVKHFASVHSEPGSNSIHYIQIADKRVMADPHTDPSAPPVYVPGAGDSISRNWTSAVNRLG